MDIVAKKEASNFIENYHRMLSNFDFSKKSQLSEEQIVELLLYRDALQSFWDEECSNKSLDQSRSNFIRLSKEIEDIDQTLKDNSVAIVESIDLEKWRSKIKPAEDAWWWYLESEAEQRSLWFKLDWIWNLLTGVSLAISASFMVSIYSAVSMSDANFATALSTIAQILGLAAIGGGAMSNRGQEMVKSVLGSLGISKKLFAEATFVISFAFMYGAYYINSNLDNHYHDSGLEAYKAGQLSEAIGYMLQAKEMNPDGTHYDRWIGKAYESLGNLGQAGNYYLQSVENGNFEDLNSLGRVHINKINEITAQPNPLIAESYLLLALQRLQTYETSDALMYKVRTNMGWALLNQQKYERAKSYLEVAIERHQAVESLQNDKTQNNMAYCFLAQLEEEQKNTKKSKELWLECIKKARPEFVHQYNWFMKMKKERIAYCIDTSHIVSGFKEKRNEHAQSFCAKVKEDLGSPSHESNETIEIDVKNI